MLSKIKNYYNWGGRFLNDPYHIHNKQLNKIEFDKKPFRYDIINHLLEHLKRDTNYLEIGVRNPNDNYNKIISTKKYSVDPGIEFKENPVDFKMTSDNFFSKLENGDLLHKDTRFDIIFIDGLHLAEQVDRDINNALKFIHEDGFIVLHDCNPPSEWHARETHKYEISPAMQNWNGTTWKAFIKYRDRADIFTCCIDTDWGVGIISLKTHFGKNTPIENPFYEYQVFSENRKESLNLLSFEEFKRFIKPVND
jgi:hypothetical protein